MNGTVLVINNKCSLEICFSENTLSPIPWLPEICKSLVSLTHLLLLKNTRRCQDPLMPLLKVPPLRIYLLQYQIYVPSQPVRIHIKRAKWLQKLKKFLDALTDD